MTTMNGAKHDVEDILASIRTSIADRAPVFESEKRDARLTALRGRSAIADEVADFELPAIFKAPVQPVPGRPNLLGRLSEALTPNASQERQERERSRTVIPFEPRMLEPPPVAREAKPAVRPEEKDMSSVAADKIAAENDGLKRNMPSFFDTRLNRMSAMSQPAPVAPQAPSPPPAPPVAAGPVSQPPTLPGYPAAAQGNGDVEDAAAQLLRPILRQWLSENMPKIVERALLTETGMGLGGSEPNTSSPRHIGPVRS